MLDYLVSDPKWLTAFSTAAVALATVVLAFLTYGVIRENKLLRKASAEPFIQSYIRPNPDHTTELDFVVANVGRGPAFNIAISIDSDEKFDDRNLIRPEIGTRAPIPILAQNENISIHFGSGPSVFKEPAMKAFEVQLRYTDIEGRHRYDRILVDANHLSGYGKLEDDKSKRTKAISGIDQSLAKIANSLMRNLGNKSPNPSDKVAEALRALAHTEQKHKRVQQ